ncbi:type III secretion system export apparatus subunit SctR [Burkholderia sp. Bp8986]|uniref:type III secretion system export apparatus subunit SctR n=1 Tax=Burkholderia sp. Bp8986 TaxID=2184550 RepID=UPI000F5B1113|nr:type III secretion system export apparatus subunit SctR [Burkholderia sp. Bp8986]RQS43252.1 EscR/YscR/HrcR family type III secretion system export apparatus protein [Burkholderia sp. Bp8986]
MQFVGHPVELIVILFGISLLPLFAVVGTCFLKISIVLSMLRNALGIQQIPPNVAIYGLSLILTFFVMAPIAMQIERNLEAHPIDLSSVNSIKNIDENLYQPYRDFLVKQTSPEQISFFVNISKTMWPQDIEQKVDRNSLIIIVPAFAVSEIIRAFKISIILYLPFLIIDIIVTNLLLSLGMMMVSPMTISLPLKILLFVIIDGWSKLLFQLVMSYK